MAIPKVCGIENEFGFVILDSRGRQVEDTFLYLDLVSKFVSNALSRQRAANYDFSQESPREAVWEMEEPDDSADSEEEIAHRQRIDQLLGSADGFLLNGARFYLDDTHPEYCTPEVFLPMDAVAHDKASELFLLRAQELFSRNVPEASRYQIKIHKNNSDGRGNSYGCHLNVLLNQNSVANRQSFWYLVRRYVPFQIARMVLLGGGKLGSENHQLGCRFQISQRADFFERLIGLGTTDFRPIFNTRDEPHANYSKFFRLHDISTDSLMCEHAIFLKVALTQVVLAMIEDRFLEEEWFPADPIQAMPLVSRDLKFKDSFKLENGDRITGLELLRRYLLAAEKYLNGHLLTAQHDLAVKLALKLLEQLEKNPFATAGKLDWTTSWLIAEKSDDRLALAKLLRFREISPDGFYFKWRQSGKIPGLISRELIERALFKPPEDTRAHLRAFLLKKYRNKIAYMNWSKICVVENSGCLRTIDLATPFLDRRYYSSLLSEMAV